MNNRATWILKRSSFNHVWFKNKYIQHLVWGLARMEEEELAPEQQEQLLQKFLKMEFGLWGDEQEEARALIESFVDKMSPRALFESAPLNRLDTADAQWMSDLAHALWMARYNVTVRVQEARYAFESVVVLYARIIKWLVKTRRSREKSLIQVLPLLRDYAEACKTLMHAIATLETE